MHDTSDIYEGKIHTVSYLCTGTPVTEVCSITFLVCRPFSIRAMSKEKAPSSMHKMCGFPSSYA